MSKKSVVVLAILAFVLAIFIGRALAQDEGGREGYKLIVNKQNSASVLERSFVADAYLKKVTRWPNGRPVQPVDMKKTSQVRRYFSANVMKKSPAQVRNYWTQLIFTGGGTPPKELASDEDVIAYVASRPGAIGYVSIYAESPNVKVVVVK